jgi:hypothetical protein
VPREAKVLRELEQPPAAPPHQHDRGCPSPSPVQLVRGLPLDLLLVQAPAPDVPPAPAGLVALVPLVGVHDGVVVPVPVLGEELVAPTNFQERKKETKMQEKERERDGATTRRE